MFLLKIDKEEQKTFTLHMIYTILDGIIMGILALNEFVLIKALDGTDYQISFLFQFSVIVLLFSILFTELQKRTSQKRKMIRLVAIITRAPLILLFFFPASTGSMQMQIVYQYVFLTIFLLFFLSSALILPVINLILKKNYKHENFSKYYGYTASANKIVMLIFTFLFGLLLDFNETAYTYVYPVVGILGIISVFILTQIEYTPAPLEIKTAFWISIKKTFQNMIKIIIRNKAYRDFEIGFMLYGFAWMVTVAVITIFFDKVLHLSYSGIAFYKNSYNTIAIILLPFFGKLLGKIDPRKFAVYTFLALLFFLFFMGLTEFFPYHIKILGIKIYLMLIFSYISYGFFAAMMALLWFIGSAYFCKDDDVADYQAVHLALTGFRGIFAPLAGVVFYEIIGFSGVFALAILALILAIGLMYWSIKKH